MKKIFLFVVLLSVPMVVYATPSMFGERFTAVSATSKGSSSTFKTPSFSLRTSTKSASESSNFKSTVSSQQGFQPVGAEPSWNGFSKIIGYTSGETSEQVRPLVEDCVNRNMVPAGKIVGTVYAITHAVGAEERQYEADHFDTNYGWSFNGVPYDDFVTIWKEVYLSYPIKEAELDELFRNTLGGYVSINTGDAFAAEGKQMPPLRELNFEADPRKVGLVGLPPYSERAAYPNGGFGSKLWFNDVIRVSSTGRTNIPTEDYVNFRKQQWKEYERIKTEQAAARGEVYPDPRIADWLASDAIDHRGDWIENWAYASRQLQKYYNAQAKGQEYILDSEY